ncbi:MAG: type II CRISPR-associated endonuclease Cas1 [Lachnospiraceae bacterium]|nr:type II CRISPR-associated endonuclease Cas1 [Lachnospiraceae bacterium]
MSWRTVVIKSSSKLMYKNGYLVLRGEEMTMVHLSEISTLIIESVNVSITTSLLQELVKSKVKVIFCDDKHNPNCELIPFYGAHNTSKKVFRQIDWDEWFKKKIWTDIIYQKIINQAGLLHYLRKNESELLFQYAQDIDYFDTTNREGHAAKVYFNALFGKGFSREDVNEINAALDYGYSIILSTFNKEICANGYLTQLGIKHINEYNYFNLSSDLMEPFRIVIDKFVYENMEKSFDMDYKHKIIDLLNMQIEYNGKVRYLNNIIPIYVKSVFNSIESKDSKELKLFLYP